MRYPGRNGTENSGLSFQEAEDHRADRVCAADGGGKRMNMQEALQQLQRNPREFIQRAGVNIPEELMNDPRGMVMHLINTNQVNNPMMQRIMPMIRQMTGK